MPDLGQTDEDGMGTGRNDIESDGEMSANRNILHTLAAILMPLFTDTALLSCADIILPIISYFFSYFFSWTESQ